MGEVAERIKNLTVSVTSPDNNIRAILRAGKQAEVEFRPGAYRHYRERDLEHQIARLATLLLTGHHRGFGQALAKSTVSLKRGPQDARSPKEREYLKARDALEVVGATPQKLVRIKSVGLSHWECRIADGALDQLSEEEFLQELQGAIKNFMARFKTKMTMLKDQHFGLNLPTKTRSD